MSVPSSFAEARAVIAAVTAAAAAQGRAAPEPPEEPLPESCCGRGCEVCVLAVYYEAVDAWRREVQQEIGL